MVSLLSVVSPIFDPEEAPSCTVLQGKTVQLSCISIGYPIISNITTKGNNGEDIDACPSINSTANFAFIGSTKFGKLNHTCNYTVPDFGIHEFVCTVAFLPWDSHLNSSFTVNWTVSCNVTRGIELDLRMCYKKLSCLLFISFAENGGGENQTSISSLQKMDDTPSVSSTSNYSNTSVTTTSTATIVSVLSVILLIAAIVLIGK